MSNHKDKQTRYIKYDGEYLWLKIMVDDTLLSIGKLGDIATRKGRITRADKLRAVKNQSNWIRI